MKVKMSLKEIMVFFVIAALIMVSMYFYYRYNYITVFVFTAAMGMLYIFYRNRPGYETPPGEYRVLHIIMAAAAVVFLLARFIRVTEMPLDFHGDEWNEVTSAYDKFRGDKGFFAYNLRQGTALTYATELVYILFFALFRNNLDLLRLLPVISVILGAAGVFYLGYILRNRNFGIALGFLYAASGWALFTSKELIVMSYLPMVTTGFILLFFLFVKKNDKRYLAGAGAVFLAGFFTYSSWVLMVPYAAYLLFEYRKEFGKRNLIISGAWMAVSIGITLAAYLINKNIIDWAMSQTVLDKGNMIVKVFSNIKQIPGFFMKPYPLSHWFINKYPVLTFVEFILFTGGIAVCVKRIKDRFHRVFLAGLAVSLSTLLISNGIGHHLRHALVLPFAVIVSGIFLNILLRWRYAYLVVLLQLLLFINLVFYQQVEWNKQLHTTKADRRIAGFINTEYGENDYLFMHQSIAYGNYPANLRVKNAYRKTDREKIKRVLFLSNSLFRNYVRAVFRNVKIKFFYDYSGAGTVPVALYEVDVSENPALRDFFIDTEKLMRKMTIELWGLEYRKVITMGDDNLSITENNMLLILKNTFIRNSQIEAYGRIKEPVNMFRVLLDREKQVFVAPDRYNYLARQAVYNKDYKNAELFYKQALKMAPEWKVPLTSLEILKKEGLIN